MADGRRAEGWVWPGRPGRAGDDGAVRVAAATAAGSNTANKDEQHDEQHDDEDDDDEPGL